MQVDENACTYSSHNNNNIGVLECPFSNEPWVQTFHAQVKNSNQSWCLWLDYQGSQTGLIQRHLEEMYMECAELLLPPCSSILQATDPERFSFIFDEMREKVLETEVD